MLNNYKLFVAACLVCLTFSVPAFANGCQEQLLDKAEAEALGGSLNYSIISGTRKRVTALANDARTPSSVASTGRSIGCEFISANLNKYTNTMLIGDVLDLNIAGVRQSSVDSISYGVAFYTKALIEGDRSEEAMEVAALIFKIVTAHPPLVERGFCRRAIEVLTPGSAVDSSCG